MRLKTWLFTSLKSIPAILLKLTTKANFSSTVQHAWPNNQSAVEQDGPTGTSTCLAPSWAAWKSSTSKTYLILGGSLHFCQLSWLKAWPNTSWCRSGDGAALCGSSQPDVLHKPIFRCSCLEYRGPELNNLNPFCYVLLGSTVCTEHREHRADPAQAQNDCGWTIHSNHDSFVKEFTIAIRTSLQPLGKMIKKKWNRLCYIHEQ